MNTITKLFGGHAGCNKIKRKKVKTRLLSSELLYSHAQPLHFLLLKPYVTPTGSWKTISAGIRDLADCVNNYREYTNQKNADSSKYKSSLAPAKTLDEHSSIRHLESCENFDGTY